MPVLSEVAKSIAKSRAVHRMLEGLKQVSPTARRAWFEQQAWSPERKRLVEEALPVIEAFFKETKPQRAWVAGSFPTSKLSPKDIDVLAEFLPEQVGRGVISSALESLQLYGGGPAEVLTLTKGSPQMRRFLEDFTKVGKKRYGKAPMKRILGVTGATAGAGAAATLTPEEAEAKGAEVARMGEVLKKLGVSATRRKALQEVANSPTMRRMYVNPETKAVLGILSSEKGVDPRMAERSFEALHEETLPRVSKDIGEFYIATSAADPLDKEVSSHIGELFGIEVAPFDSSARGIVKITPSLQPSSKLKRILGLTAATTGAGALVMSQAEAEERERLMNAPVKDVMGGGEAPVEEPIAATPMTPMYPDVRLPMIPEDVERSFEELRRPKGTYIKAPKADLPGGVDLDSPMHLELEEHNAQRFIDITVRALNSITGTEGEITPGSPIPEEFREIYEHQTGNRLPEEFPEDDESLAEMAADIGLSMAAFGIGMGLTAAGLEAAGITVLGASPAAGPGAPVVAAVGLTLLGGALAATLVQYLRGSEVKPMVEEFGVEVPEILKGPVETAEWLVFPEVGKLAKYGVKYAGKFGRAGTELVAKPLRPVGELVWERVIVPPFKAGVFPSKQFGRKSIAELFQPAVERLEKKSPKVAEIFRKAAAMRTLSADAAERMGKDIRTLAPTERRQIYWAFKYGEIPKNASSRVKEIYSKYAVRMGEANLSSAYNEVFNEHLGKMATKKLSEASEEVSGASIKGALDFMERGLKPGDGPRKIQKALSELIEHPNVNNDVKQYAIQLYDLPANTVEAASDAARRTAFDYLTLNLERTPGVISDTLKPGYVVSKFGRLKDVFIDRDVEMELQALKLIPKISSNWYTKWFLGPWKTSKVIMRPATHMRNLMSNTMLNDIGGLPFYRVDMYWKAIKGMRNGSKAWKDFVAQTGIKSTTFGRQELHHIEGAMKYNAGMFDRLYNVFDKAVAQPRRLYSSEEAWFKFAKYLHNLEQGMGKSDAALDAVKWTLNYGEITPAIARTRMYFMPFFTWQAKVLPLVAEAAVKHPVRVGKWVAAAMMFHNYAIGQAGITEDEWSYIHGILPDYMRKGMYLMMPWRDDRGRLQLLNLTYIIPGLGDINEYYQRGLPEALVGYNPVVTMASALHSHKKYSGAPLYNEWDPPGTKWAKISSYMYQTLMPAPFPGNLDWNMLWEATQQTEGAASPQQAVASFFGFKLRPVDVGALQRRKQKIRNIFQREIEREMRKELGSAKSSKQVQRTLRKYQKIRREQAFGE